MNIAISSENTGKVTEDAIFSCAVCIKKVRNNSILWIHKGCNRIQQKLKENSTFKCKAYAN